MSEGEDIRKEWETAPVPGETALPEVVLLSQDDTAAMKVNFFNFINEAMEYFVEVEGWSPIYAFQVLMKQNSEVGLAELKKQSLKEILETPTPDVMLRNIVFYKDRYSMEDVTGLVEKVVEVLSNYKDKEGLATLRRDLLLIARQNI
jgi:hypothetical protein